MAPYSSLLLTLVSVLETSQTQDGLVSKQALLNSTNELKETLANAKKAATNLPGGDMSLADQDEVIKMLEQLRDYKTSQLKDFARMTEIKDDPRHVAGHNKEF